MVRLVKPVAGRIFLAAGGDDPNAIDVGFWWVRAYVFIEGIRELVLP